jgi:hypothetical protein
MVENLAAVDISLEEETNAADVRESLGGRLAMARRRDIWPGRQRVAGTAASAALKASSSIAAIPSSRNGRGKPIYGQRSQHGGFVRRVNRHGMETLIAFRKVERGAMMGRAIPASMRIRREYIEDFPAGVRSNTTLCTQRVVGFGECRSLRPYRRQARRMSPASLAFGSPETWRSAMAPAASPAARTTASTLAATVVSSPGARPCRSASLRALL